RQPAWKAGALPTELLPHFYGANISNKFFQLQVFFQKKCNLFFAIFAEISFSTAKSFIIKLLYFTIPPKKILKEKWKP
ncbi:hypothetical protein, partial [Flavobacterium lindanitolerans]|uniref:hypothetical protein n=1 Tax=Flavobacterium lindanitolerans TaxID=428988 RepID=UPI002806AB5D